MQSDMIPCMTRLTIAVPDDLAEKIKAAAGGNVSAWLANLAQRELVAASVDNEARWYAEHPSYAEDAEAERYAA
jgi:hypothetical protein